MKALFLLLSLGWVLQAWSQTPGCTDPKSPSYNPDATVNDGSCTYGPTFYNPVKISNLPAAVKETSGLLMYKGILWTHNDSSNEPVLYGLDPSNGNILRSVRVNGAPQIDWEDITRDETHGYIGDFGNNNGNRTDLRILKFPLEQLDGDAVTAELLHFSYPDQTDFSSRPQNHDFDAEALLSLGDSLYIFSKNWVNLRTKVYVLPKSPGSHVARLAGDIYADGLITGAAFNPVDSVILLTGYTKVLSPIIWLLWDFRGADVFGGNKRKININLALHQMEAAEWLNGSDYLLTNEAFTSLGNVPAALFRVNTGAWISAQPTFLANHSEKSASAYPNPAGDSIVLQWETGLENAASITVYSANGEMVVEPIVVPNSGRYQMDVSQLPVGNYWVLIMDGIQKTTRFTRRP